MRLCLHVLIGLSLAFSRSVVELDVLNKDVLFGRHADSVVKVHIQYPSQEILHSLNDFSELCFTLNGKSCKCFPDFLVKEVTLPTECISDDHYWFAVTLSAPFAYSSAIFISDPIFIPSRGRNDGNLRYQQNFDSDQISLVLPVTLDDLSRCAILLRSLRLIDIGEVHEMFIFVPDHQLNILEVALSGFIDALRFKVTIIAESALFYQKSKGIAYPYAIQMAIKLLAAKMVKTKYYLTLDADIVLLQPLHVDLLIKSTDHNSLISHGDSYRSLDGNRKRALYDHEERHAFHPNWWSGSEELLNMKNERPHLQGFGVTPSLLSTFGSLLTLASVEIAMIRRLKSIESLNCGVGVHAHSSSGSCDDFIFPDHGSGKISGQVSFTPASLMDSERALSGKAESLWINSFGRDDVIWSEYTLYRTVLDHYQVWLS